MKYNIGAHAWPGLSKLAEEAGEVLQVIGKVIGADGARSHWDGTDLHDRLGEELADLMAACVFVTRHNGLNSEALHQRLEHKLALFEKWHREQIVKDGGK